MSSNEVRGNTRVSDGSWDYDPCSVWKFGSWERSQAIDAKTVRRTGQRSYLRLRGYQADAEHLSSRISWLARAYVSTATAGSTRFDERKILKWPHLDSRKIGTAEWGGC